MLKSSGKQPVIPATPMLPTQQVVVDPVSNNNRASGTPSPSRKIAKGLKCDIVEEVNFWETSVVCYVINANPPSMLLMVLLGEFGKNKIFINLAW